MANKTEIRPAPKRDYRNNLRQAFVHWRQALVFGLLWALFLAAHSFANLYLHGWQDMNAIARFSVLVFAGALLGGVPGWLCAIVVGGHRVAPKRFAAGFVVILVMTIGTIAILFALQYRQYYAQWHSVEFTVTWFFQFAFTTASAFYLFAVQGLRTLLPLGPVGLLLAALLFMKMAPSTDD